MSQKRQAPEVAHITNGHDWLCGDWDAAKTATSTAYVRKDLHDAVVSERNEMRIKLAAMEAPHDNPPAEWMGS